MRAYVCQSSVIGSARVLLLLYYTIWFRSRRWFRLCALLKLLWWMCGEVGDAAAAGRLADNTHTHIRAFAIAQSHSLAHSQPARWIAWARDRRLNSRSEPTHDSRLLTLAANGSVRSCSTSTEHRARPPSPRRQLLLLCFSFIIAYMCELDVNKKPTTINTQNAPKCAVCRVVARYAIHRSTNCVCESCAMALSDVFCAPPFFAPLLEDYIFYLTHIYTRISIPWIYDSLELYWTLRDRDQFVCFNMEYLCECESKKRTKRR